MKKVLLLLMGVVALFGCGKKEETTVKPTTEKTTVAPTTVKTTTATQTTTVTTKSFNFVIYEKDSDNDDLSNNTVVASYEISYTTQTNVADALIKNDGKYYFVEGGTDYITISSSGLVDKGYFQNYGECAGNTEIDVSWSYLAVNGEMASKGIKETTLTGLTTFGFVIQGWK